MKSVPYDFILDLLTPVDPNTKPMFGHTGVYAGDMIVMFLIDQPDNPDNGVCLATSGKHLPALSQEIPSLKPLEAYGEKTTQWRLIPAAAPDFEEAVTRACELILKGDPRIGRVPKRKKL